MTSGQSNLT